MLRSTICRWSGGKFLYHGDSPFWCRLGAFAAILEQFPFWNQIREDGPHRMHHRNGHAWAIERLTRSIYDDVLAFFATEEGQAEYEAWEREQAELKKKRAAATKVVAAHSFIWFFWADRYDGISAHRG